MLVPEDSPLRNPPRELSRKQILILDGIRYAAEIADLSYERLTAALHAISASKEERSTRDIAVAMADAWSIVDAVHRFHDFILSMPGLKHALWLKLFKKRTEDICELRNYVQHFLKEIDKSLTSGGQLWGYISWAEVVGGRHTGKWLMISPGTVFVGDEWFFIGPMKLPFPVPEGCIRLNAFGKEVYLGRAVEAVREAVRKLTSELATGNVKPHSIPAIDRRGADVGFEGWIEVEIERKRAPQDPASLK